MAVESGPLAKKHERDFAAFRRSVRRGTLKPLLVLGVLILLLSWLLGARATHEEMAHFERARAELLAVGAPFAQDLVKGHDAGRGWLTRRGMPSEVRLYDTLGQWAFRSAKAVTVRYEETGLSGIAARTVAALHGPVLRVAFLLIAGWRIWLAAVVAALLWGMLSVRAYNADDLLGQTGNGRLFFSGLRARLAPVAANGAPDLLVTGLACPAAAPPAEVKKSALAALLERYQAANETNLALAAIIIKHGDMPAYAPALSDGDLLDDYYAGASLEENAPLILEKALVLQAHYRAQGEGPEAEERPLLEGPAPSGANLLPVSREQRGKLDRFQYAEMLQQSMHRVLTPEMRRELAETAPAELAAAVLAVEAGKVLGFFRERSGWIRKSNFPQLCARAVLHSIPSYGRDFNFDARSLIRRGLIYGLRGSVFGPVRFPVDLTPRARALRQWVELLIASPHTLEAITDEVELVGLIAQSHGAWRERFFEALMLKESEALEGALATGFNLVFVPAATVIKMMHRVVDLGRRARLAELIEQVSRRQRQRMLEARSGGDEEAVGVPDYERIYPPPAPEEIKALAARHGLAVEQVRDWMSYRVILNAYGWLGKRVGHSTVSEDCLVAGVFEGEDLPGRNSLGFVGRNGMVALRATSLAERFGPAWIERFTKVSSAAIAHSQEEFDRLLKGFREIERDDAGESNAALV